ncbi:hypothetical protein CHS0354_035548 [Potamilus streckersoni]|uniref:Uncharacterized protein n=1 Tax=Potamilus streckersoni TaxID=2493646 RepID=A0AAE0RT73_9BIVA|nr:hypothetical protein CHS0354_035548 [Potamilus streckersoni]
MADHITETLIRNLLPAHKKALEQLQALDTYIAVLNKRMVGNYLDGNYGYGHHLNKRSSFAMRIRHDFKRYEEKKWRQVLEAARQVYDEDSMAELESRQRNHGRDTTVDQTASQLSFLFSECYRYN